jgi:hypothetical protein
MTVQAFCAERGLTEASFYHWRKQLRKNAPVSVGGGEKVHHFGGQKAPVEWLRLGYVRRRRRTAMVTQDGLSSAGLTCGAR